MSRKNNFDFAGNYNGNAVSGQGTAFFFLGMTYGLLVLWLLILRNDSLNRHSGRNKIL